MAQRLLTAATRRWALAPVAARIAIIYLLSRLVTTGFFILAARGSSVHSRFGAEAMLGDYVLGWDAQWYWTVAVFGYPSVLPVDETGRVTENAWAFMPVYAHVAQAVGLGDWGTGALLVSLVSGFLACLALHRLLRPRLGGSATLWAVTFFASGPLAALFQVGYAEALFVLLLLVALDLVVRHRYGWLYLVVPVMGFTRPGVLAFALFLGLHGIVRWRRRRTEPLPTAHIVQIIALGLVATIVGFSWQIIAGLVTADPDAYLKTELSWRRNWLVESSDEFFPFEGFMLGAQFWAQQAGLPAWTGWLLLVILIAAAGWSLLYARSVRTLGVDIRLWSVSYLLYLLAVFFPQSSTFRLLLPLTPWAGALAVPRSRSFRWGVLMLCLGGQWLWIQSMYGLAQTFWQVP